MVLYYHLFTEIIPAHASFGVPYLLQVEDCADFNACFKKKKKKETADFLCVSLKLFGCFTHSFNKTSLVQSLSNFGSICGEEETEASSISKEFVPPIA